MDIEDLERTPLARRLLVTRWTLWFVLVLALLLLLVGALITWAANR